MPRETMKVCKPCIERYKLIPGPEDNPIAESPCEICGLLRNDWMEKWPLYIIKSAIGHKLLDQIWSNRNNIDWTDQALLPAHLKRNR